MNHSLLSYLKGRVDWSIKASVGVTLTRDKAVEILDALLNECHEDGGECAKCGEICCPHKNSMHFHHDGCPACSSEVITSTQLQEIEMLIVYTHEGHDLFQVRHDEVPRTGDRVQHAACIYFVHSVTWEEDGEPTPAVTIELTR